MSLFDTVKDDDIIEEIKGLDMGNMTPIEAMNTLYNLQNKIKNQMVIRNVEKNCSIRPADH